MQTSIQSPNPGDARNSPAHKATITRCSLFTMHTSVPTSMLSNEITLEKIYGFTESTEIQKHTA